MASGDDKKPASRRLFGKVLARASTSPVNLGVAGAAAVAAAAIGSWPILALGGAAYAALVAFDTANPSFWKKTTEAGRARPAEIPRPDKVSDPSTRAAVEGLMAARKNFDKVLGEASDEVRSHLESVAVTLGELEQRAARLVQRAEQLARYLAQTDRDAVAGDVTRLAAREKATRDAEARKQMAEARVARQDELRTLDELTTSKERLDGNLLRVVATMAGLASKVVHMRTLDEQAVDDLTGDMSAELENMVGEMRTFEETLKTLVEVQPI